MAKKVNEFSILQPLAKELGYKNADELKEALGKEEVGRGTRGAMGNIGGAGGAGTGFLGGREVGSGFSVGIKKRLAGGQGLGQSVAGGFKDFKETLSLGNIKKRALEKTFGGPGFISAFARGKLKKKFGGESSPTKEGEEEQKGGEKGSGGGDASSYLGILAKSALVLPGMARDTNVLRQNLQKLVKLFGGKAATKKEADAEKEESPKVVTKKKNDDDVSSVRVTPDNESKEERKKDEEFFAGEDKKEAEAEAARKEKPSEVKPNQDGQPKKVGEGKSPLEDIIGFLKDGLISTFKSLFSPMKLLKLFGKIFVIGTLIFSLFKGITAAWDKWKETGSIKDALISGLGAIVDFLTFGFFGEDSVKKLFEGIADFFEPLIEGAKGVYYTVKDWIVNNVGIPRVDIPIPKILQKIGAPASVGFGPYYPFKSNPRSEADEISERPLKSKDDKKLQESTAKGPKGSGTSSTESESKSPSKETPKMGYTAGGEKLNFPGEVIFDNATGKYSYKGISFNTPENQKELDTIVKAIDDKAVIEYQGKDASGAPVTKTINGATGEIGVTPPKQPTPVAPPAAAPSGGGGGGAGSGGEVSASSGGGKTASPPSELAATPPESGSELSDASAQIAEAQRMESAADMGSSIDASSTNNSSGSTGGSQAKIADVYDTEFANLYAMA